MTRLIHFICIILKKLRRRRHRSCVDGVVADPWSDTGRQKLMRGNVKALNILKSSRSKYFTWLHSAITFFLSNNAE